MSADPSRDLPCVSSLGMYDLSQSIRSKRRNKGFGPKIQVMARFSRYLLFELVYLSLSFNCTVRMRILIIISNNAPPSYVLVKLALRVLFVTKIHQKPKAVNTLYTFV